MTLQYDMYILLSLT